jgi:hypothetical protein
MRCSSNPKYVSAKGELAQTSAAAAHTRSSTPLSAPVWAKYWKARLRGLGGLGTEDDWLMPGK